MKIEVKINSEYGIFENGIFKGVDEKYLYKEVDKLWEGKINRCIIHMIPTHDTTDEEGRLLGFCDSIFFTMVVYNLDKIEYYIVENRDGINSKVETQISIFKDLSTMIACKEPCRIVLHQYVDIYKA